MASRKGQLHQIGNDMNGESTDDDSYRRKNFLQEDNNSDSSSVVDRVDIISVTRLEFPSKATSFDFESAPVVTPSYGCLLVPVAIAVWWYWLKRAARRVVRRVLPFTSSCGSVDIDSQFSDDASSTLGAEPLRSHTSDRFHSWEEVLMQGDNFEGEHSQTSLRFVRWMKGRNDYDRRRVQNATRQALQTGGLDAQHTCNSTPDDYQQMQDQYSYTESKNSQRYSDWQCIQDVSAFELCATKDPYSQEWQHELLVMDGLEKNGEPADRFTDSSRGLC